MRDTPLGDVGPLIRSLELASGSAVAHAALDAVREAYRHGQTIGLAYVQLLRAILEPLGIAVLDAGHPAVRTASRPFSLRALERAPGDRRRAHGARGRAARQGFRAAGGARARTLDGLPLRRSLAPRAFRSPAAPNVEDDAELEANVVLRPIAERAILPTVAYVGGPGEVAYFAQATAIAQVLGADVPLVVPRWSGMIIEPHVQRLLGALLAHAGRPCAIRTRRSRDWCARRCSTTVREALARYASRRRRAQRRAAIGARRRRNGAARP